MELREEFIKRSVRDYHELLQRVRNQKQIVELREDMVKLMKDNQIEIPIFEEYYWQHYVN